MKEKHKTFYPTFPMRLSKDSLDSLSRIVDDTVEYVSIPTPKGWKCPRKGCKTNYKHKHTIFPSLNRTE